MSDDFYKPLQIKATLFGVLTIVSTFLTFLLMDVFDILDLMYSYYYYPSPALMALLPLMIVYLFLSLGVALLLPLIFAGSLIKQGGENGLDTMKTSGILLLWSFLGPFIGTFGVTFLFYPYSIPSIFSLIINLVGFGLELAAWIMMIVFFNELEGASSQGAGKAGAILLVVSIAGRLGWFLITFIMGSSMGPIGMIMSYALPVLQAVGLIVLGAGFAGAGGSSSGTSTSYGGGYQSYLQQQASQDDLTFNLGGRSEPGPSPRRGNACPSCGAPVPGLGPDMVFCPNCGARL